ncbi:MAG: hypothetical protein ACE5GC_09880, partial [Acidimicrobiia bacterium]
MASSVRLRRWIGGGAVVVIVGVTAAAVLLSRRTDETKPTVTTVAAVTTTVAPDDPAPVADAFLDAWAAARWSDVSTLAGDEATKVLSDWWLDLEIDSVSFSRSDVRITGGIAVTDVVV